MSLGAALAQQRAQVQAAQHMRMMGMRAYYQRKGMEFISAYEDRHTGKAVIRVQRPTTIPKVSR